MRNNIFLQKITACFIDSLLTPLIIIVMFFLGFLAFLNIPREEDPQIIVPMVDVLLDANGIKAKDVVEHVTKPLETILKGIPDVEHIYSNTEDNRAVITLRFFIGTDQDKAISRVSEKIRAHISDMPHGIKMPIISSKSIDDVGILVLSIYPNKNVANRWSAVSLYETGLLVQKELTKIDNIGSSYIIGGMQDQIRIEIDLQKLLMHKLSINQVIDKIRGSNQTQSVGEVFHNNNTYVVSTGTNFKGIKDMQLILITSINGNQIYLKDLAKITTEIQNSKPHVWHFEKESETYMPSISLVLAKKPGSNAIRISEEIQKRLELIKGTVISNDLNCTIVRDYGRTAAEKSNRLLEDLFGSTICVVILMIFALGVKEGIVVLFVIPATILMTIFMSWMIGFTINRVSLFALVFSIGILVDDAIVFIENIVRRLQSERTPDRKTIAIDAVIEVGKPTIMATLTIIVALLPMLFVRGLMGPYMKPIPVNASVAMLISLLVAFCIVPWLLLKIKKDQIIENKKENFLSKIYKKLATKFVQSKKLCKRFLICTTIVTFCSFFLFLSKDVIVKMLPFDNKSEIMVQVDLKEGSTLQDTDRTLREIGKKIKNIPEISNMQFYIGIGAPFNFNGLIRHTYLREKNQQGEIQINLVGKKERTRNSHEIAKEIRSKIKNFSNIRSKVLEVPPGPPVISTLLAEVYGPDYKTRYKTAMEVKNVFKNIDFVTDIDDSMGTVSEKFQIEIDFAKLNYYQVNEESVYQTISAVLSSNKVGYSFNGENKQPTELTVELPEEQKAISDSLLSSLVMSKNGLIELSEIVKIKKAKTSHSIFRHNGYDANMVMGEMCGRFEAPLYGILEANKQLKNTSYRKDLIDDSKPYILWDGEWEITYTTFIDLGFSFLIAIFGIYVLLVAQFKSYKIPIVVLTPIPLVLVGIIFGHFICNAEFTATSMIGLIALCGIVVRNSLLLVEFIRNSNNPNLKETLIDAGSKRITPIVLTAVSAMIGSIFMFFDPIFQGLAISLFFGLMSSTALTLFVIPALYVIKKT